MATCQLNLFHNIHVCFCAHSVTPNDLCFVRCLYIYTCRIGVVEFPGDFTKNSQLSSKRMLAELLHQDHTLSNMNYSYIHM